MQYKYFQWQPQEVELKSGNAKTGILTIDAPNLNALSTSVLEEFSEVLDFLSKEKIRAFIITGKGKAFIAGADISEMASADSAQAQAFSKLGQDIFTKLENMDIVSIAAVNGFAFGGGLELAMSCDIRIFSEAAKVGLPEVSLGLIPGFGGTQRLARLVGISQAKYLTLTCDRINAAEAHRIGLAQKLTTSENLISDSLNVLTSILSGGPSGVRSAKKLIHSSIDNTLTKGLEQESHAFGDLFGKNSEASEGISAFMEKRAPDFTQFP